MNASRQPKARVPSNASATPAFEKAGAFNPPDEPHWHRLISEAAYFRAERRHFASGGELGDWLAAEMEVKEALTGRR